MTSGFGNLELMQELTNIECYKANVGQTGQLKDMRDGKYYWVTKLADGNCWMTQNLALDLYGANITKENSDITADSWTEAKTVQSGLWNDTTAGVIKWYKSPDISRTGHESYGNYYSWQAATAGTAPSSTGTASGSICPKNWKLPTSNNTNSGSFGGLTSAAGIANAAGEWEKIKAGPYYFQPGGSVYSGSLNSAGSIGWYWSSIADNGSQAYYLSFTSSSVNPSNSGNRYYGFSVRCLVQGS